MELNSLNDVLMDQLGDLYDAERQLVEALPEVARAAHSSDLQEAIAMHLEETRNHVDRLAEIFAHMGTQPRVERCEAMRGLIAESEEIIEASGRPAALDAALIAAAQRVEHYEIAAYGTARALARELGLDEAEARLDETLSEEAHADKTLTKLAAGGMVGSGINEDAVR